MSYDPNNAVRDYVKRHREFGAGGASDWGACLDLFEERFRLMRDLGLAIDPEIARIVEIWRATICQRMPEVEATALAARFRKTLHDLAALWGD